MKRAIIAAAMLMLVAAGPATKPASRPVVDIRCDENAPADVKAYFDKAIAYRAELQDKYLKRVDELKKNRKNAKTPGERKRLDGEIENAKASLAKSQKPDFLPPVGPEIVLNPSGTVSTDIKVGWTGCPDRGRVIQVIDDHTVLVHLVYESPFGGSLENYMTAVFAGVDAANAVDGSIITFPGAARTTAYRYNDTVGSQRSVVKFEPMDVEKFIVPVYATN